MQSPQAPQPLAVRPNQAAVMIGLSRAAFWRLLQNGEIRSVKVGAARLVPVEALREWLDQRSCVL